MTAARFGPRLKPQGGVTFRLWAPAAKRVDLLLADVYPMRAEPHGWFEATLPEAGPGTRMCARGPSTSVYFRDPDDNLVELTVYDQPRT